MQIDQLYKIYIEHSAVITDSRQVTNGCLFFALKGNQYNGNQYAEKAIENGAAYAIIDEAEYAKDSRFILVDNTLETLQKLANHHRKELKIPILAITGTNGKTTTKELVSHVLMNKFNLVYTKGNLNNHIGVPLTLLSMTTETQFGVVEMGANHPFEIKKLCEIAEPDFGLITNIGKAHLEGFASFENIIKTKAELYDFLNETNGTIFYNSKNPILSEKVKKLKLSLIPYGDGLNSYTKGNILHSDPFLSLTVTRGDNEFVINTQLVGVYNFENVLASVCVGNYFGIEPYMIKNSIENYTPSNNRSQFIKSQTNTIFLDAYNANPTSIEASLLNFMSLNSENKCIILGDMLELGKDSESEHENVIRLIEEGNFSKIILVGETFFRIHTPKNYLKFPAVNLAINWISENKITNSTILIKGSRGIQLERIVEFL